MPYVDQVIRYMQTQQGERIVLENDQPCVLYRPGGEAVPTQIVQNFAQLNTLIQEILPDSQRGDYAAGVPVTFPYQFNGTSLEVEVSQPGGKLRVGIGAPGSHEAASNGAPASADHAAHAPAAHAEAPAPAAPRQAGTKRVEHIDELFRLLHQMEASDLHISSNEQPMVRVHGTMQKLAQYEVNTPEYLKKLLWQIAPKRNQEEWERDHDTDFAYEVPGIARFRCNFFQDRHGIGAVFRLIPTKIVTAAQLNLPQAVLDLCFLSKGLVVVTGPTGSGKSTTLAAVVDHVNKHRDDHIITIEDPVEFVHNNINCLVNQREVHVNTNSFSRALRAALREDPDIVLVGEMRDLETVAIAIETAETGHLVFGTLHTTTAASTVDRIIDQFPADQQEQIRVMLSESLKAVIAQTLCRTKDGRRVAALEILLVDPAAANLIREGKTYQLPSMMQIGKSRGCITMNDSLFAHVKAGRVEPKEAYIKSVDKVGLLGMFEKEGIKVDLNA